MERGKELTHWQQLVLPRLGSSSAPARLSVLSRIYDSTPALERLRAAQAIFLSQNRICLYFLFSDALLTIIYTGMKQEWTTTAKAHHYHHNTDSNDPQPERHRRHVATTTTTTSQPPANENGPIAINVVDGYWATGMYVSFRHNIIRFTNRILDIIYVIESLLTTTTTVRYREKGDGGPGWGEGRWRGGAKWEAQEMSMTRTSLGP